ncbi:hypothetical protein D1AOALGA4SA_6220 [Olavius algarvensis Delta 1 endosymbiont]|nr:hypothetical protein D1AOALGA4SA_6220 [Olavius algarvensis Delta 1 endosymbiont]
MIDRAKRYHNSSLVICHSSFPACPDWDLGIREFGDLVIDGILSFLNYKICPLIPQFLNPKIRFYSATPTCQAEVQRIVMLQYCRVGCAHRISLISAFKGGRSPPFLLVLLP